MKKTIFTFFMVMLATTAAFSQAQFGVRAGANWATIVTGVDYPDGVERPWRPGAVIGLATNFQLGETFSVAPELNFSQRGELIEVSDDNTDFENSERRLNYLEIPVLFRLSFGDGLKGYVNAGPALSYWLGGNDDGDDINFDDFEDAKRLEIGASLGGGVQLDTEAGSFLVDLRYTRGFTDMLDGLEGDNQYKNQLISVSLIALFPSIL